MKRRDFLKVLAGIAAAPMAVAAATAGFGKSERDPHEQIAFKMSGTTTGRMSCKRPNHANVMRAYSKADAERTLKMMRTLSWDSGTRYGR